MNTQKNALNVTTGNATNAAIEPSAASNPPATRTAGTSVQHKAHDAASTGVWLFFVDDPGSFGERHGKSYLTRRRRGGAGGGGGSLTGGAVLSAYRWA